MPESQADPYMKPAADILPASAPGLPHGQNIRNPRGFRSIYISNISPTGGIPLKTKKILICRRILPFTALLLFFCGLTLFLFTYRKDEKRFTNITSRLFVEEMSANTLNLHYSLAHPADFGIYDYSVTLSGYSPEGSARGQLALENTLASLYAVRPEKLTASDAYLHRLLTRYLENTLTLNSFAYYSEPLSPSSGAQSQLPILLAEYTLRSKKDIEDYLALLDQTDEYFASLLLYEQEKAAADLLMPASSLKSVRTQCDTIVTSEELEAGSHFLQTTFAERLQPLIEEGSITEAEAGRYSDTNDRLLKTVLLPAYTALGDGLLLLEDPSIPLTGLAALPQGKEYYEALLICETGSYRTVSEIQELLTKQFAAEYETIRSLLTQNPEIAARYAQDESVSFPLKNVSAILADLQERMQGDFPPITGETVNATVKPVSASLEGYCAPAFYLTAPLDDTAQNVIYINRRKTLSGLELYTTLAHEGYPGHLYQTVYANRQLLTDGERPAKKLLWYGGYLEGWALYVEFLSYDYATALLQESGLSQDALTTQLEKHNRSLQLCLYSLLDVMIHHGNASFSSIAKLLEGFGITDSNAAKSVYTYIAQEPCNYLKYYLGYLEILSLQEEAGALWGDTYTDYRFHCFYLDNGPADFLSLREQLETAGNP